MTTKIEIFVETNSLSTEAIRKDFDGFVRLEVGDILKITDLQGLFIEISITKVIYDLTSYKDIELIIHARKL